MCFVLDGIELPVRAGRREGHSHHASLALRFSISGQIFLWMMSTSALCEGRCERVWGQSH
jgi:hypothetical protein